MRKFAVAAIMAAVLVAGSVVAAAPDMFAGLPVVRVIVNGRPLDVPGVVVEGRSMAPVRAIGEAVGGTVAWDGDTYTATITAPNVAALQAENAQLKAEVAALKAKPSPAPAPAPAPAGGPGSSRSNPAPAGTTLAVSVANISQQFSAKVALLETLRGEAAWEKIKAANSFNDEPAAGTEYIAARFKFELVAMNDGEALDLSPVQFDVISTGGREYDVTFGVAPEPLLRTKLYAGATHEGWAIFQVAKDDAAPVVAYGRKHDGTGGIWFSLAAK